MIYFPFFHSRKGGEGRGVVRRGERGKERRGGVKERRGGGEENGEERQIIVAIAVADHLRASPLQWEGRLKRNCTSEEIIRRKDPGTQALEQSHFMHLSLPPLPPTSPATPCLLTVSSVQMEIQYSVGPEL